MKTKTTTPETRKQPILFLDINGVLNSESMDIDSHEAPLDPVNIRPLNRIIDEVGPRIVITSDWRYNLSDDSLRDIFEEAGIQGSIVGSTPLMYHPGDEIPDDMIEEIEKGQEISAWFERERDRDSTAPDFCFAILDENSDLAPYQAAHVATERSVGLTDGTADKVITLLRGPESSATGSH